MASTARPARRTLQGERAAGTLVTGKRKALVIDDDAGIRVLVSRILERNDFEVTIARDGAEGIEILSHQDFSVIVLDLMMPRLDGVAVVKYLVQYFPEKLPNVIVATAFGTSALEKVCPPVHHFLEKPFDVVALVEQAKECSRAV